MGRTHIARQQLGTVSGGAPLPTGPLHTLHSCSAFQVGFLPQGRQESQVGGKLIQETDANHMGGWKEWSRPVPVSTGLFISCDRSPSRRSLPSVSTGTEGSCW